MFRRFVNSRNVQVSLSGLSSLELLNLERTLFWNDLNVAKRWNIWNVWNGPILMMNGRTLGGLERAQRWNCWNRWNRMSPITA
jgi:hypothetical protein